MVPIAFIITGNPNSWTISYKEIFSIPIGLLSEDAQEARNRNFNKRRESTTRKAKPTSINDDIVQILLILIYKRIKIKIKRKNDLRKKKRYLGLKIFKNI